MKKLLFVLLTSFSLQAADITLTYTPTQLKFLERVVTRINAERIQQFLAATPEGDTNTVEVVTANSYMQSLFEAKLNSIVKQEERLIAAEIAAKYAAAPTETQTQVETTLQVTQ